jgi:hypothetical protein
MPVVRQNFSRDQIRTVLGRVVIRSIHQDQSGGQELQCVCAAHIIRMADKLIRTRQLDRNDGRGLRIAPENGSHPKLQSESCRSASPSRVQDEDVCGLHGGNEHTPRAIASDGVRPPRRCGPASLLGSLRPNAPPHRWHECSTAPHGDVEIRRFRVTRPYHPLFQQEFELVSYRQDWGEDRVWFQDKLGRLHSRKRECRGRKTTPTSRRRYSSTEH